jgi:GTP-binding protein Era
VKIWKRVRDAWSPWRSKRAKTQSESNEAGGERHLGLARESLEELLADSRVPESVRLDLASDYAQLESMLDKLNEGHIHVAVLGRVGVGKSSVLNALLGAEKFAVSPLHGETRETEMAGWRELGEGGVYFIDTPGLDEVDGESREKLARDAAARADLVLFVVDADLTAGELEMLRSVADRHTPVLLVLNKADRYTDAERDALLGSIRERAVGHVRTEDIVVAAADPAPERILRVGADGVEHEEMRPREPQVEAVRDRLWIILEAEGKSLAALNASVFAGDLSDEIATRLIETRRSLGEKVIRTYSVAKGVAVALNPVPVADLFAVAMIDVSLVIHLSRIYGLPLGRAEAGSLIGTIATQMVAIMGTVWAIHVVSSALKLGTGGLSVAVTAGAQGAVAYYSTYVVGRVAQQYLAQGMAWGPDGPKAVVRSILDGIDRESLLGQAGDEIRARLRSKA